MKRKNLNTKLSLKKKTILQLNATGQNEILGAGAASKLCPANTNQYSCAGSCGIACTVIDCPPRLTQHICITVGGSPCPTAIDNCS